MLDAEVRIGELMREVRKAKNQYESASNSGVTSTKKEVIESMGFNKMQVSRFETLAAHPEIVAQAAPPRSRRAHRPTGHSLRSPRGFIITPLVAFRIVPAMENVLRTESPTQGRTEARRSIVYIARNPQAYCTP